jgi:hypothetical protein
LEAPLLLLELLAFSSALYASLLLVAYLFWSRSFYYCIARICKPFVGPRNLLPASRNRFLGSLNVYKYGLWPPCFAPNVVGVPVVAFFLLLLELVMLLTHVLLLALVL